MNVRHSKAYDRIAVEAGNRSDIKDPTPETVAKDNHAVQLRDSLWADYERQLRDAKTYTLETVREWLAEQNSATSLSGVHRDRRALLDRERAMTLAAGKARAVIEAAAESGEHDFLKGGRLIAGQLLFDALGNLSSESLDGMSPPQILRMVDSLALLSKAHAETDLIRARLAEINKAAKAEIKKATSKTKDGKVTREVVYEIIDKIMRGEQAA
ncbi:MAG: DUF3486 family protein [Phycisphaerae bacterium]|nr:DUF3486 family protein [Phycisphaerae bacterium]